MSDHYHRFIDEDLDWMVEVDDDQKKEWDESKHPRVPGGSSEGGQFGSGGGGGEAEAGGKETSEPKTGGGGKVKVEKVSDFTKDDVGVYEEVRNDPERQQAFLDTWNRRIGKQPGEFKKEFLGNGAVNGNMTLNFVRHGGAIEVRTFLKDDRGSNVGQITSTIYPGQDRVHMDYYVLDRSLQGHGVMKQVMAQQMKLWQDIGIKKVDLLANIDVGGHAWARYGFTPVDRAWYSLSSDVERDINRMGSGDKSEGYEASSWDEVSDANQRNIERAFNRQTFDEFYDSEVTSWRENGDALEQAKSNIVEDYNNGQEVDWAMNAIASYRKQRLENGKPEIPFSDADIANSIQLDFKSRYGDGRGNVDVTFDDEKLFRPTGVDQAQMTLPGVPELKPHEYLNEEMRSGIDKAIVRAFDTEADSKADDTDPPEWLANSAREQQGEYWSQIEDSDRYKWAERNAPDLLGGTVGSEGTGEISAEDAARLRRLTDGGPKNVWAIADSKWGKDLLMNKNWDGELRLDDKQAMARFEAYVGKAKK